MYPISNAAKALFDSGEQRQVLRITGNGLTITDADVVLDSFSIDRYACNGTKLEVGTAVASEMSLKLNNADGRYDDIVFEGAELYVEIGIADWTQENPNITYIPCGYFTPDEQPRTRDIITLHALDRMMNFDAIPPQLTPWTDNNGNVMTDNYGNVIYFCADLSLPATVSGLIRQACDICQVPFTQDLSALPNYNLTISALPALQQDITFRNIIQWCAGIMGTNAWIDWEGKLRFSWYGTSSVYTTTMANRFSSDLSEDDITITGVAYTNMQNITILYGNPGYTIDMSDNYLAAAAIAQVLPDVNNVVNGFTYRPFTASVFNAPYLWPMDAVTFTDKNGDSFVCALTNVNFGINGATALQSIGESLKANSGVKPSAITPEQARLIESANEKVEQLDQELDQEGIFNRLTDNGEIQGLLLYNGKIYLNATYINTGFLSANRIKGGTIDGNTVNAKQFQIVDADGNVIASFNDTITIGQTEDVHAQIDNNSFEMHDKDGNTFFDVGDARNQDGYYELTQYITYEYSTNSYTTSYSISEIISIEVNGSTVSGYTFINRTNIYGDGYGNVTLATTPAAGSTVSIRYKTTEPVLFFTLGTRLAGSERGRCSVCIGKNNFASAAYAYAEGLQNIASGINSHSEGRENESSGFCSHTEGTNNVARGYISHAEGSYTIANTYCQHVFGTFNTEDTGGSVGNRGDYVEMVGNGRYGERSNARTLSWNGNEWIAGTLTQASDNRLKTEDGEVPDLSGIKARAFHWNANKQRHDDKLHLGYFAQDVEAIAPYLVDEDAMGYKSLDYNAVFVAKITALEKRVAELERRINTCR